MISRKKRAEHRRLIISEVIHAMLAFEAEAVFGDDWRDSNNSERGELLELMEKTKRSLENHIMRIY